MRQIPRSLLSVTVMLWHVLAIPLYFLGFVLFYRSQWMLTFLDAGKDLLILNILILTSILIGVLCGSRIPMTVCRKHIHLNWWQYALWSLGEVIVFSAFAALYMALIYGNYGYFPALGHCLKLSFCIFPYAYVIIAILFALIRPDEPDAKEEDLIRFVDTTGRLKIVIAADVLLFIEARENYVHIHYLEGELHKEYALRQSMRGIEQLMERHGIIRCQRSYFVNPQHVKVLRRDKEGIIQAELDLTNIRPVPVSPKYYEDLSKML